jgi:hypothetical protein
MMSRVAARLEAIFVQSKDRHQTDAKTTQQTKSTREKQTHFNQY